MRKKNLLLITLFAFFVTLSALAGPRTFTQAQKIAEAKANSLGIVIDTKAKARARVLNGADSQTQTLADYYVFPNGTNKGFTIVSGDDCMPEIVGYTDKGTYDETRIPDAMKAFLESYKAMVKAVKAGDKQALKALNEYKQLKASPSRTAAAVSPLLGNIQWNQGFPYNCYCPKYDGTNQAATGCVATAMAQVMGYWKYPSSLQASTSAYTTTTNNLSMSAVAAGEPIDWDNILDTYPSNGYNTSYNTTQALAVGKLMYLCGLAVKMDYGASSGANVSPSTMSKYFGYDADLMVEVYRGMVSLAKWTELLDNELKEKRPVLYCGASSDVGHQFVCDGSDGEGLYHINWGWGGYQDGYFDVTVLNPAKGGIGSGNASDGFNRGCRIIIGIQPDNGKTDDALITLPEFLVQRYESADFTSGMEITKGTRYFQNGNFEINIKDAIFNTSGNNLSVKFGYGISDGNGGYTVLAQDNQAFVLRPGSGSAIDKTFNFGPKKGTYTIYALYCKDGETTWKRCTYGEGIMPYTFTATETELTQASTGNLTATLTAKGELSAYSANTLEIKITNNGDDDYIGDISLYWDTENTECPETATESVYATIPAHGSVTRDATIYTNTCGEGDIYVWVKDAQGNELVTAEKFTLGPATTPVLTLVSVENNATADDYETENASYGGRLVKVPKVNDDYAWVRFGFKNVGVSGNVRYYITATNIDTDNTYWKGYKTINVPADGTVTYIEESYTPGNIGGKFMLLQPTVYLEDADTSPWQMVDMDNYYYWLLLVGDEERGYRVPANMQFLYVAGKTTAVDNIQTASGYSITGGEGEILVRADKKETLAIYSIDGQQVAQVTVDAGTTKSVSVPAGIYVVKGKKVVVR